MSRLTEPPRDLVPDRRYRIAGRLGSWVIRLWGASLSIDWIGEENIRLIEKLDGKVIWTFWHAGILPLTYTHRGRGVAVLVSQHHDGEIISQIICRLGYGVVRGSSTRGGLRALLEMVRAGREGHALSVTPDGPRGPRHELQSGVLHIAQRSGLPIVPLAAEAVRRTELDSWDHFQIPHPFSRVGVVIGSPFSIPSDVRSEDLETIWGPRVTASLSEVGETALRWRRERIGRS